MVVQETILQNNLKRMFSVVLISVLICLAGITADPKPKPEPNPEPKPNPKDIHIHLHGLGNITVHITLYHIISSPIREWLEI